MARLTKSIKSGVKTISNRTGSFVFGKLKNGTDNIVNRVEERFILLEGRITNRILVFVAYLLSTIFFSLTIFFALKDYVGLNNTLSFLIISIIFLVSGIILKLNEMR